MSETQRTAERRLGTNFRQLEAFIHALRDCATLSSALVGNSAEVDSFRTRALTRAAFERQEDSGEIAASMATRLAESRALVAEDVAQWRQVGWERLDASWNSFGFTESGSFEIREASTQKSATLEVLRLIQDVHSSLSDDQILDLVLAAIAIVSRWNMQETTFLYWYAPVNSAVDVTRLGPAVGFCWVSLPKSDTKSGPYGPYSHHVTSFISLVGELSENAWVEQVRPGFFAYMSLSDTVDSLGTDGHPHQPNDDLVQEEGGDPATSIRKVIASQELILAMVRTDEAVTQRERDAAPDAAPSLLAARAGRHFCLSVLAHGLDVNPKRGKGVLAARNAAIDLPNLTIQQGLLAADAAGAVAEHDLLTPQVFNTLYRPFGEAIPAARIIERASSTASRGGGIRGLFRR